jgi:hypothetical protein
VPVETQYCGHIGNEQDRSECALAEASITTVIDSYCQLEQRDRFCSNYSMPDNFSDLPALVQDVLTGIFVDKFGFEESTVADAYNSLASLHGLPPHPIIASKGYETEIYRGPRGWATGFASTADMLAFRESDGSPVEVNFRLATSFEASYYFDIGFFAAGGFKFVAASAEDEGAFNFDLALEGGYHLPLADRFGLEFFAGADLGYAMSDGPIGISAFDAAVGGGIRGMIRLIDEPVKSNMPYFSVGIEYMRLLDSELSPDQLNLEVGFLFNYI